MVPAEAVQQVDPRADVARVGQRVEGAVERLVEAEVEQAADHDHGQHHARDRCHDATPGRRQHQGEGQEDQELHGDPEQHGGGQLLGSLGQQEGQPDQGQGDDVEDRTDQPGALDRLSCRRRHSAITWRPNDSTSSAREASSSSLGHRGGEHVRCGDDQHDALDGGHDLGPRTRRRRAPSQGQIARGDQQQVAGETDQQHPRARHRHDVHAEDEDQEGVGLHVERRAQAGDGALRAGQPAVDEVERQRDRADRDDQGAGHLGAPRLHDERGDRHRHGGPHQRHRVGRAQRGEAVAAHPALEQQPITTARTAPVTRAGRPNPTAAVSSASSAATPGSTVRGPL